MYGARHCDVLRGLLQSNYSITEGNVGCKVECQGDRWKLPLVANRERCPLPFEVRYRSKRNLSAGVGWDVDVFERVWIALELRSHFHNHVILIQRSVHGGHLTLTKRVVQHVINHLRCNAES